MTHAQTTALATLNDLPRRKGYEVNVTIDDLLTLEQAKAMTEKAGLNAWSDDSVFIRVETVVRLYKACTRKGRMALLEDELIGGWFGENGGSDNDADGEFCSTPSHNVDDAPVSIAEFRDDLEYCSTQGILFIY